MKNRQIEFGSQNRLKKILSSAALCAMMTTNLAGAATYDVSTVAAKGIGDGLATADFNSIVDTLKGWVLDDNDTNDSADDTATFAGDICNGSGDCLSDAMNASAGGKFVDGTNAADAVFTGGNVGIGTDNPTGKLHLKSESNSWGSGIRLEDFETTDQYSIVFDNKFRIGYNNATRFVIESNGNVGIGTDTPGSKLEAKGVYGMPETTGTSQTNGSLRLSQTGGTGVTDFGMGNNGDVFTSWIQSTNSGDLSQTYSLLLNPNGGNVGIGTDSPLRKFVVKESAATPTMTLESANYSGIHYKAGDKNWHGSIDTGGQFYFWNEVDNKRHLVINEGGNVGIGTDSPTAKLHVDGSGGTIADGMIIKSTAGGNQFGLYSSLNNFHLRSVTAGTDALTVAYGGNIGIGTGDIKPVEKLEVNGAINIADTASTCDAAHAGTMKYEVVNDQGTFLGCSQIGAGSYDWVNLQVFGQQ